LLVVQVESPALCGSPLGLLLLLLLLELLYVDLQQELPHPQHLLPFLHLPPAAAAAAAGAGCQLVKLLERSSCWGLEHTTVQQTPMLRLLSCQQRQYLPGQESGD
jgi:hypothetical protein